MLREAVDEVGEGLKAAKKTYAESEADIETNLQEMAAAMGDGGGNKEGPHG